MSDNRSDKETNGGQQGGYTAQSGDASKKSVESVNPWLIAQESLRRAIDEHSYNNWFAQTRFESYTNGILAVQVPSQFFANWLNEHYLDTVNKTLATLLGDFKTVRFIAAPEPERDSRESTPLPERVQSQAASSGQPGARRAVAPPRHASPSGAASASGNGRILAFNPRYTFNRFVIGASNRFAHAAAKAVVDSPARAYNPLFLYGQTGLGKTHLMHAVGQELIRRNRELNIVFISSELFTNQLIESIAKKSTPRFRARYRQADVLLIDDIHFIAGKEATQEEFFHTFNELYDMQKQIVISSDRGPKEIQDMEERLVSRFEWGLVTDIQPPDFETRMAILQNKATEEQVALPDDVTRYIATLVTSNIRELEGALVTVKAYAGLQKQPIDLPLVDKALHDIVSRTKIKSISYERIQKAVADRFDVRIVDLRGRSRQRQIAFPRQLAMYLCKSLIPSMTLNEIGEAFGGKDHTTVLYACQKISEELDRNEELRQLVGGVEVDLRG
jgi:chromosomal replication initiator protein